LGFSYSNITRISGLKCYTGKLTNQQLHIHS